MLVHASTVYKYVPCQEPIGVVQLVTTDKANTIYMHELLAPEGLPTYKIGCAGAVSASVRVCLSLFSLECNVQTLYVGFLYLETNI